MDELTRIAMTARSGDPDAVGAFVSHAHEQVWRLCARLVDEQAADDLTQETLLRVVRALPGFRAQSSARTWMLSIARRVCMDELRHRVRQTRDVGVAKDVARLRPQEDPDVADMVSMRDLLARLDPDRRLAFVLTQVLRVSYEEAAEICGCPAGTIRSRVSRARSNLVAMLEASREHRQAN